MSLTDALQPRYTYLPTLITMIAVATGSAALWQWLQARRVPAVPLRLIGATALIAIVAVGVSRTADSAWTYRFASGEASALSSAVLANHPILPHDATIFLVGSPLDVGSARWVFADPRLGDAINNNVPKFIKYAPSVEAVASLLPEQPFLIYERDRRGTYIERVITP
jgi:hypothetical protein